MPRLTPRTQYINVSCLPRETGCQAPNSDPLDNSGISTMYALFLALLQKPVQWTYGIRGGMMNAWTPTKPSSYARLSPNDHLLSPLCNHLLLSGVCRTTGVARLRSEHTE